MSNQAASGNGAVAFWFRAQCLSRAVPERKRWPEEAVIAYDG